MQYAHPWTAVVVRKTVSTNWFWTIRSQLWTCERVHSTQTILLLCRGRGTEGMPGIVVDTQQFACAWFFYVLHPIFELFFLHRCYHTIRVVMKHAFKINVMPRTSYVCICLCVCISHSLQWLHGIPLYKCIGIY